MKIQVLYEKWCNETKRSGGILVGGSIQEFFKWMDDNNWYILSKTDLTKRKDININPIKGYTSYCNMTLDQFKSLIELCILSGITQVTINPAINTDIHHDIIDYVFDNNLGFTEGTHNGNPYSTTVII